MKRHGGPISIGARSGVGHGRRITVVIAALMVAALGLAAVQPASAQSSNSSDDKSGALLSPSAKGKVSSELTDLAQTNAGSAMVVVEAVADGAGDQLLADLELLGLDGGAVAGGLVTGRLPVDAIPDAGKLDSLHTLRRSYAITRVGDTTSQGDVAMEADDARTTFAVDGSGVSIGTLSDSYDCLSGAAGDVTDNDLPSGVIVLDDTACPASDEGRAMMQLIHDSAPGSSQLFHTAFNGQADFADGIVELRTAGADIIVDDIFYLAEPFFQDGPIAQAVDTVVADGATYFSSAGNAADNSYESGFNPSGTAVLFTGGDAHDFDPGAGVDVTQRITLPVGATLLMTLQWDQPFGSVSGAPGATSDLDLGLLDAAGNLVAMSATINIGGDPVEVIGFTNGTAGTAFDIVIEKFTPAGGPNPGIKHVIFRGGTINEYATNNSTVVGHANAEGAIAVGAAFYNQTPPFGTSPALPEPFTSLGGTPMLFDTSGAPVFELREAPSITAPDGGNTTFFGVDVEPDGFPNFFGTSASAPAAAAAASLMLDFNPGLSNTDIRSILESTASDMATPGYDLLTGHGLISAQDALDAISCIGLPVTVFIGAGDVPTAGNDVILGTPGPDVIDGLAGDDAICGLAGDDDIRGGFGNDVILGDDGADELRGREDSDIIVGGPGPDFILGNDGDDTIFGDEGADVIFGGSGNDFISGGPGNDRIGGSGDDDTLNGDEGRDNVAGGGGVDIISGGSDNDTINAGTGNDVDVRGNGGNDTMSGNGGNDVVNGDGGNDIVRGGNGDDIVNGNAGDDQLFGNPGNDTCDGGSGTDTANATNCETILNVP
jgi:Ca2+-binding RTX toxin-like protein